MNTAEETIKQPSTRNYGIDCLKILSMIMVATLHVLGQGVLKHTTTFSVHYELGWALEILCFCAVNCYAIISGYVNYGTKFRYSKILQLYLQVAFYTVIITGIFKIWKPELVGKKILIKALFPFAFYDMYWYYTAYFCMSFFIPFFNRLIKELDSRACKRLVLSLILVLSVIPTLSMSDTAGTARGYSTIWLSALYLIGACIRKYYTPGKYKRSLYILGYFLCAFFAWLGKLVLEKLTCHFFGEPSLWDYVVSYTSPFILFCGIFLVLFFSELEFKKPMQTIIRFFAPASFGVYLIHVEPLVWDNIMHDAFIPLASLSPVIMCLACIGAAIGIWLLGSLVDTLRRVLFKKVHSIFTKKA